MADLDSIATLATAGGTLVLAVATFSATRSATRSARVAEEALKVGVRPVLFNARAQDPPQRVGYVDDHWVLLREGLGAVQEHEEKLYLSIPLRNVGPGLAVLHGWHLWPERQGSGVHPPELEEFRRHSRDLYVPAGDIGFWQCAMRDRDDPLYPSARESIHARRGMSVDVLYSDHEGGQRTITRFFLHPRSADAEDPWLWTCATVSHWNLDRPDPR
ncbi:MAG TPA: hypothetical protein VFW29_08595 [Solirubrobacteraceae bacterium]|nr:hypothetical protein [Solirubrobacteraceae bacterium]